MHVKRHEQFDIGSGAVLNKIYYYYYIIIATLRIFFSCYIKSLLKHLGVFNHTVLQVQCMIILYKVMFDYAYNITKCYALRS